MITTSLWQRHPLALIVFTQLCGTSLWFSVNGVGQSLSRDLGLSEVDLSRLTLTVQGGFIVGTLGMPWEWPVLVASVLALLGGALIFTLGDGPHLPAPAGRMRLLDGLAALCEPRFRAVAGGYYGHCWELYAGWMLVPFLVAREVERFAAK